MSKNENDDAKTVAITIHAPDRETLRELVRTHSFDFGCRPKAIEVDGGYSTPALVSRRQLAELGKERFDFEVVFDAISDDRTGEATIGRGDRFDGGRTPPQGLGSRPRGGSGDLGPIMNVGEIGSAMDALANEYGISTFGLPNATAEGKVSQGGSIGGIDVGLYHLYLTAGVHARERGGPDSLIYFISDLLHARKHSTGLVYGAKSYTHADVIRALNTGIVFFPLVNPDGVRWDQQTDSLWRKNRNPASATPGVEPTVGVDINRNYDFLWDYRLHFDPAVAAATSLASDNPVDETFHGQGPFSEAETRNVAWVFDQFPRVRWYMDIHSAAGEILYNWGDDNNQVSDPGRTFRNPAWDGKRGAAGADAYQEWIEEQDYGRVRGVAGRVAGAMHTVGGRQYKGLQAFGLYATAGASDDYAYSRFSANPGTNKAYGFTMEFGYPTNFYPTLTEFHQNVQDIGAGLMEFCLSADDAGLA
ncbi:M14 family metallopeptidase [Pseudarthrobacter sp. P1]|uniref:M14 family metallopeptidase n=1 Tax=Pseudarthrobacter sp. P1 TaxID=3418418 RepID=UPI003CF5C66A